MEDLKPIIAKNISSLRVSFGMTQLELAEKLNYTDKAVSKWERGESVPDVTVLKNISDLFGVTVDYLLEAEHEKTAPAPAEASSADVIRHNRIAITGISIVLVWLLATFAFVLLDLLPLKLNGYWLAFVCAIPASVVVWLVFNSLWFNVRRNYLIVSILMWTTLAAVFLIFLFSFHSNIWLIFALGIPGQVIILLWSRIRFNMKRK